MKRARASARSLGPVILLLVAGCGFHLRTWDLTASFESVHVSGDSSVTLTRDLERALGRAGVEVVSDKSAADVVVRLSSERESRRSVSFTGQARAAEYEMTLSLAFGAEDADGNVLIPSRAMRAERTYRLDQDNIVGSAEEQTLVVREMRADLVQRIIRSLGTVSRAGQA